MSRTFLGSMILVFIVGESPARCEAELPPGAGTVRRPVSTDSIVARDPSTGELGVAVQSHWFSTQANLVARDTVWDAMAAACEAAEGDLAERLMVALEAGEAEGGDLRGGSSPRVRPAISRRSR